jgi:hypothetical protein
MSILRRWARICSAPARDASNASSSRQRDQKTAAPRKLREAGPRLWLSIPAAMALLIVPLQVRAERPSAPKLLPKDVLAYARIADSQELIEKFQQTAMGRLSQDEEIKPLVTQLYGAAAQAFTQIQDEIGVSLEEILAIPQGEVAVAVVGQEQGMPALAALLDAGEQISVVERLLDRALEEAERDGNPTRTEKAGSDTLTIIESADSNNADGSFPAICIRENTVLFSTSSTVLKSMLSVWNGEAETTTFAENRKFNSVMRRSTGTQGERPQISFFVDPIELFKNLSRDNFGAQAALALLPSLGLDGVRAAGGSVVFATEQFDSISYIHLLLDSPREGVLEMLTIESGDTTPENWVPYDAASYTTVYWNVEKAFAALTTVFDKIRGEGALDGEIQRRLSGPLKVDFGKDILGQISGRFTHVSWFEKPARLNSGTNLVGIKLKDAETFRKTLDRVITQTNTPATKKAYGETRYYEFTPERRRRRQENVDEMLIRLPTPCVAVVGDYLLLSDSVKCLEAAVKNKRDPSKSLGDELDFKLIASKVEQQLGSTQPSMIAFQRPEESMRSFYSLATSPSTRRRLEQAAANNPFFKVLNDALRDNPLPPFSRIAKYLAPGGGMMVSDDAGIHYTAFGLKRE